MAQYKVPQDVEADDKLLGPFSFRQFVYLMIAGGLIALAVGLFQLFPLLAIIPLPPVLFFGALALPLRKDQPMETYLAALVSFYMKPRKRVWEPGQRESTIEITAPKITEDSRTRNITGEEATHRLSFLADLMDTEGYAIKGGGPGLMREELVAEANATSDMFENNRFSNLGNTIIREENERHAEVINSMKQAIERNESMMGSFGSSILQEPLEDKVPVKTIVHNAGASAVKQPAPEPVAEPVVVVQEEALKPELNSAAVVMPGVPVEKQEEVAEQTEAVEKTETVEEPVEKPTPEEEKPEAETPPSRGIMELANNADFSVETIAKQAKRIKEREKGEVFISLH